MQVEMNYKKSTKNTHVYENTDDGAIIPQLYIKKHAFTDEAPLIITVTVEEEEAE